LLNNKSNRTASRKTNKNYNKTSYNEVLAQLAIITNGHPKLNNAYKKSIEKSKKTWLADIKEIHKKYDTKPMHVTDGKPGIELYFTKMEDPNWLLLWDAENPRRIHTAVKKTTRNNNFKQKNTQRGKSNFSSNQDVGKYYNENIIPVIATQRTDFDKNLSVNEKEIIELARQKIEVRKAMFKSWYESDDFVPGKRANDPNFDNIRKDMQESMMKVREIALAHNIEIRESLSKIKTHKAEWITGMREIAISNKSTIPQIKRLIRQNANKAQTPISFLLFN